MMKYPTNGKEICVFFDTKTIGRYDSISSNESFLKCDRFPESKSFSKLICFIKTYDLKCIKICFSAVVIREIMHQMVDVYKRTTQSYKAIHANYKKVLGETIKKEPEFAFRDESENVMYVIFETKRFLKRYSEYVKVIKPSNDFFQNLLKKALYKDPPFSSCKTSKKEYTDAGFKDAVIGETILQEATNSNSLIIFFSDDGDFAGAFPETTKEKILVYSNYNDLIEKVKELYSISETDRIVQEFKTNDYLWSSILEYVQLKGKYDLSSVKILSAKQTCNTDDSDDETDSENDNDSDAESGEQIYIIKASILIEKALYCFAIKYDCSANEVINVEIEQEGE